MDEVKNDSSHPINNGVHMQAHHLISCEAVKMSRLGPQLVARGYNINTTKNLMFAPSTPAGACHLGVQLHRGDHIFGADDEDYDDDEHPIKYHRYISARIKDLKPKINDCDSADQRSVQKWLNNESKNIASKLKKFKLALTTVYKSFDPSNAAGCRNIIDIKDHESSVEPCNLDRNHRGYKNPMYKSSKKQPVITAQKHSFKLRVGK